MSRKVKTPAKMFLSDINKIQKIVIETLDEISSIVGHSLGPGGRNIIIESDLPEIPNKNTKDGVTIFRSLGYENAYKHLITEQTRDVAIRTVNEAGDGTTTATIIAAELTKNLLKFCKENPKESPQRVVRIINGHLNDFMIPYIEKSSIAVKNKNRHLLEKVATISANGDKKMARAVMEAFELTGFSSSSHVTIQELSGKGGSFSVNLVEGFPIERGYEESIGKFHPAFINDQANQRCILDKPLFILFDGAVNDMVQVNDILQSIGRAYVEGNSEFKNVVLVAHNFSDQVLTTLAFNFPNPGTINIVPLKTPINQIINSQTNFLMDISAFTGAKVFDMNNSLSEFTEQDFGKNMEKIELYRFRTTLVGESESINIELRADTIKKQIEQSESKIEKILLEERLGKLTSGIAQLKIYGSSNGELKESSDRAEDAVCAVRAAISHGCLPGGCRVLINMILNRPDCNIFEKVVSPSLIAPFHKLLQNAGYNLNDIKVIQDKLADNEAIVYDVENHIYGDAEELGLFDATLAIKQALSNAVSISSVMGTLGGIIAFPRDGQLEIQDARDETNFNRSLDNAENLINEADIRP